MPDFSYEEKIACGGLLFGLDEAGRGPWCGPVVAACVCWPERRLDAALAAAVNDSKKLSARKRAQAFEAIASSAAIVGVGSASAAEIDALNILQASFLAMERALDAVRAKGFEPAFALIDGNRLPRWRLPCRAVVGGDGCSLSIAAASIVAKVTRDRLMRRLAAEYPAYGWEKNAGYGTRAHREALEKFGVTPHHRKTYAPVRRLLAAGG